MATTDTPATTTPAPSAPARHDPFSLFRSEMDRLVESFFGKGRSPFGGVESDLFGALSPSIEMKEDDKALTLTAELPGMTAEGVELAIRNGVLTLSGEKKRETEEKKGDVLVAERRYGSFRRAFTLPEDVDADRAEAAFRDGVLTLTLPKKPEAATAARRIAIR
jgi:HSP20 family protein